MSDAKWYDGSVTLITGEKLSGLVFYHVKTKTVYIEVEDETRSLKASKVTRFNFFDKEERAKRHFISLPMEIPNRPTALRPEFLEVIRNFGDHVILSQLSNRKAVLPAHKYTAAQTINLVVEHWHIIDEAGTKHLYFSFIDRTLLKPKLEFFNSMLFKELVSTNYYEVMEYAHARKLSPENPQENLLLLDYNTQLMDAQPKNIETTHPH